MNRTSSTEKPRRGLSLRRYGSRPQRLREATASADRDQNPLPFPSVLRSRSMFGTAEVLVSGTVETPSGADKRRISSLGQGDSRRASRG